MINTTVTKPEKQAMDQRLLAAGALILAGVACDLAAPWMTVWGDVSSLALTSAGYVVLALTGLASRGPLGRSRAAAYCALFYALWSFAWGLLVISTVFSTDGIAPFWLTVAAPFTTLFGIIVAFAASLAAARSLQHFGKWKWVPAALFAIQILIVLTHNMLTPLVPLDDNSDIVWSVFLPSAAAVTMLAPVSVGVLTLMFSAATRESE